MKKEIKQMTIFRSNYEKFERRPVMFPEGEGRTKQYFKEECDINTILKKYATTGVLPEMIKQNGVYGDFSQATDYQESLNQVMMANEQFAALPAAVRERFANDPVKFLEFAEDPKNGKEMVGMGLATEKVLKKTEEVSPEREEKKKV